MEVVTTIAAMRGWRRAYNGSVGLVPTMGYLHDGHLALVRRARPENDAVVVSIFTNPLQFGPAEDFARYPRDLPRDLDLLRAAGVDVVFAPDVPEMYPPGFATTVVVEGGALTERLEGAARPGHFRGVATVVTKLFNIVRPERAYFGQKDAQQLAVVRRLVADLALSPTIVAVPTVRDRDGLALSSRNVNLSPEERARATALYRALSAAGERFRRGERAAARLTALVRDGLAAAGLVAEYISLADPDTLEELATVDRPALLSLAVRLGSTRLIDNVLLEPNT